MGTRSRCQSDSQRYLLSVPAAWGWTTVHDAEPFEAVLRPYPAQVMTTSPGEPAAEQPGE